MSRTASQDDDRCSRSAARKATGNWTTTDEGGRVGGVEHETEQNGSPLIKRTTAVATKNEHTVDGGAVLTLWKWLLFTQTA